MYIDCKTNNPKKYLYNVYICMYVYIYILIDLISFKRIDTMSHWSETKDRISKGALQWRGFSCHQGSIDKEEQASACLGSDASSLSHPAAVRSFGETQGIPVLVGLNQGVFPFVTMSQASSGSKHVGLQRNQRVPAWSPWNHQWYH